MKSTFICFDDGQEQLSQQGCWSAASVQIYTCVFFSIVSVSRAVRWCWCELCCPSWWITQTDRREVGGGPLVMEPHQSHRWATGVYCEAHYRALNIPCGTMRGLEPEGGPEAARDWYGDPGELAQAWRYQTFILSCQPPFSSHQNLNWYHRNWNSPFFFPTTTAELCLKSLQRSQPKHVCSSSTSSVILPCVITYKDAPQSWFSLFGTYEPIAGIINRFIYLRQNDSLVHSTHHYMGLLLQAELLV